MSNKLSLSSIRAKFLTILKSNMFVSFLFGLLYPLGFSPFNFPGLTLLSLALLFFQISRLTPGQAFVSGFSYAVGMFSFGVSWVMISIHDFGNIAYPLAGLITLLFIFYLSLYPSLASGLYRILSIRNKPVFNAVLFGCCWVSMEWLRANLMTGFPWLLAGSSQINSPLKYLAPIIGTYGLSLIVCFVAALIVYGLQARALKRFFYLLLIIVIMMSPLLLKGHRWVKEDTKPLQTALIQLNVPMQDKWDEQAFNSVLYRYQQKTLENLSADLVVLPESSIPVPQLYVNDYLAAMNEQAKINDSAVLMGILDNDQDDFTHMKNTVLAIGEGQGSYAKQHLVPFGEYIPSLFQKAGQWLQLPDSELTPGSSQQPLIQIKNHPVATFICYEIAYPQLLRHLLPQAHFILSVSENGWFGHSLASYQQLQLAQMLSLQAGRYQAISNNDGLSSIINDRGEIIESLPAFKDGVLRGSVYPVHGMTPWVYWGDNPVLIFMMIIVIYALGSKFKFRLKN